jgi:protein-disulfide isomerase
MYVTNFLLLFFSWRDGRGLPFITRLTNSGRAAITILGCWVPLARQKDWLWRILTILALSTAFALIIGAEPLTVKLYFSLDKSANELTEARKARILAPYVSEWDKQPVIELSVMRDSALSGDSTKGTRNAPVQIVEFSDYGCPHCQQLGKALSEKVKSYPNEIEVIHKDFPLDNSCNQFSPPIHVGSCKAAEFARCAGEQGKFWEVAAYFHDQGIPEASNENDVKSALIERSESLGIDRDAMTDCLNSGRQLDKIKKDAALGDSLNLQATPSVWINGKFLQRPHPDIIEEIIKKILKTSAPTE